MGKNGDVDAFALCRKSAGGSYAPSVVGARFAYETSEDGVPGVGHETRLDALLPGGVALYSFDGEQRGKRWVVDDGTSYGTSRIVYVDPATGEGISDQYFEPPSLRLDYSRETLGEQWRPPALTRTVIRLSRCPDWQEELGFENVARCPTDAIVVETVDDEVWTVTGVEREVTVIAGTFQALCHERRCTTSCRQNERCYARGVGKLTETGDSQRDELSSVCFPP